MAGCVSRCVEPFSMTKTHWTYFHRHPDLRHVLYILQTCIELFLQDIWKSWKNMEMDLSTGTMSHSKWVEWEQ